MSEYEYLKGGAPDSTAMVFCVLVEKVGPCWELWHCWLIGLLFIYIISFKEIKFQLVYMDGLLLVDSYIYLREI